ncbi:GNAT family N-acetyltransferase [Deinococcus multiflagellatus]|uniref:GNAT family N-acetyltransferase n=1 Tax=Deinococcus multiflagellatus TaxID=1656887 RepID=A0ABW1ZI13_9DEIO|nr:GNAT family N-acetyltransferase [Deinococcus multiflagellatus]MBZ9714525.1 GNAT family N-acetyltransferase [Deinococcus multiflagellatus]
MTARTLRSLSLEAAALALPALRELRPGSPHTASPEALQAVLALTQPEGYRLVEAFEADQPAAVAVAGSRVMHLLHAGRTLYVDDLVTRPEARGRGHAGALLAWLEGEARNLNCTELHLDSGVGPARFAAHRLYLNAGLNLTAHHFAKELP